MGEITAIPRNAFLGGLSDLLEKVRGVAAGMPTSPTAQLVNALIGHKPEMADDAAYGFPPTQGAGATYGPKPEYASDIADLLPMVAGPAKIRSVAEALAKETAKHPFMLPGSAASQVGALTTGGRKDLMYSHGLTSLEDPRTGELVKELSYPSLAITAQATHRNPFDSAGILVPKIGFGDPAYSPASAFNRDAYLARTEGFPGGRYPTAAERVQARGMKPPPRSEGYNNWADKPIDYQFTGSVPDSYTAAILSSPSFRSLREFEKSPKGADLILPNLEYYPALEGYNQDWKEAYRSWVTKTGVERYDTDWLKNLRTASAAGDPDARKILQMSQFAPSDYGELKVSDLVPVTGHRWAGAILPQGSYDRFAEQLAARGIPAVQRPDASWGQYYNRVHEIASAMQDMAGPVKERSLRVAAGWAPGQDVAPPAVKIEGSQPKAGGNHLNIAQAEQAKKLLAPMGDIPELAKKPPLDQMGKPNFGFEWVNDPGKVSKDVFSQKATAAWMQNPAEIQTFKYGEDVFHVFPGGKIIGGPGSPWAGKLMGYLGVKNPMHALDDVPQ